MKKLIFVFAIAILLAGSAVGIMSTPSYAQGYGGYNYPPPPQNPYASPWVGPSTPWTYYNGDWFLNGILYYFFGNNYGWAPYYSYAPIYIVRPNDWYAPRWNTWYQQNPHYWQSFTQRYPYWRGHRQDQRYDQKFFEQHHRDQGGGWQKGFQDRPSAPAHPGGQKPAPARVTPPERQKPAPARVAPPEGQKPAPARVAPLEGQKPAPARVAPPEGQKPAPARVTPPEGKRPAPAVAPPEAKRPAPARVAPPEGQKGGAAGREKVPEGKPGTTTPGEEKK